MKRGDVVWDVGANVGFFTFASAAIGASVVAIEADPWLATGLEMSAKLQHHNRVSVIQAAAASGRGVAQFCIAARSRSSSHLEGYGTSQTGGVRETIGVQTIRLDDLQGAPTVIKIDVERAELDVLKGASRILEAGPLILCEVAERNADAITALLHRLGYVLHDEHGNVVKRAAWCTVAMIPR